MFSILVDIQFGTVLLEFGLESVLKNSTQSSLEVMDNVTLPLPPMVPLYSIARGELRKSIWLPHRYEEGNLAMYALSMVDSVESSENPCSKAFCGGNSISRRGVTPFDNC